MRPLVAARNAKRAGRALSRQRNRRHRTRDSPRAAGGRAQPLAAVVAGGRLSGRAPRLARPACLAVGGRGRLRRGAARGRGGGGARGAVGTPARARVRRLVLPNFDVLLRSFAAGYRRWLCQTACALLAVAHAVNAALIAVFTELTSRQSGTLLALTVPALVAADVASGTRRCAAARAPSSATSTSRSGRPARARPGARRSRRDRRVPRGAGAALPAGGLPGAGVRVRRGRGRGRRAASCAGSTSATAGPSAGRQRAHPAGDGACTRRCCCATCCGRCWRSWAPATACRSPRSARPSRLRTKLVFFFASVTVFTSGLVLLFALSPSHARFRSCWGRSRWRWRWRWGWCC